MSLGRTIGARSRLILLAWLVLFLARAWLYASLTPLGGQPDELFQMGLIRLEQMAPAVSAGQTTFDRVADELVERYESATADFPRPAATPYIVGGLVSNPSGREVYYPLMAGLLRLIGAGDPLTAWYLVRWISILFGLGSVALTWLAARLLFPGDDWPPLLAAGLTALLPQFGVVAASVNPDNLAILYGAGVFACLAWLARSGARFAPAATLVALTLILPWMKRTTYFILPLLVIGGLWALKRRLSGKSYAKWVWTGLLGLGAAVVALVLFYPPAANWVVIRIGIPFQTHWVGGFDPNYFRQRDMLDIVLAEVQPFNPAFWLRLKSMAILFYKSAVAYIGHMDEPLGWGWYAAVGLLAAAGLAGLSRAGRLGLDRRRRAVLVLYAVGVGLSLAFIFTRYVALAADTLAQGRYLFPALVPVVVLWAAGFRALWPERALPWAAAAGLGLVWLMDLTALWGGVVPWFYRLHL